MSNSSETCSVCLSSNAILIEVSATDKNKVKLSSKLRLCVPEVDWSGNCCICLNCIEQLEIVYTFCRLCLQSYEVRRQQALLVIKTEEAPLESKEICDFQVESRLNEDETLDSCFISIDEAKDLTSEDRVVQRQNRCIENCMDEKPDIDIENMPVDDIDEKYIDLNNVFVKTEESCDIDLREAAEKVTEGLLPERSKPRYEKTYEAYRNWCDTKGVQITNSEMVVLSYFGELVQGKKASTLWATYSMLRATLNLRHNIDISKFARLRAFLKKQSIGYKAKKSSVLSQEDIDRFLNAPIEYLLEKVALIIGISGACRCDEIVKMKIGDIDFLKNKIVVVIPDTKTYRSRSFVITKPKWIKIITQYKDLRKNIDNERFFLQMRLGKITKQPCGHNSIGNFPKKIAAYLKLNNVDTFTGHCFRRTAATLLANTAGGILHLKRLGGWKFNTVAESYVENSLDEQLKIANMLSSQTEAYVDDQGTSMASCSSTSKETTV